MCPNRLQLCPPQANYQQQADDFKQEFFDHEEYVIHGSGLYDELSYDEWLALCIKNANPKTVSHDWVVTDTFFAIRKLDHKIVGIIDVRHSIKPDFLATYAGHIGYSIRPSMRGNGYGSLMLKLGLEHAKKIGLTKVMLGCFADNTVSQHLIAKYKGKLTESKPFIDGTPVNIYWITL